MSLEDPENCRYAKRGGWHVLESLNNAKIAAKHAKFYIHFSKSHLIRHFWTFCASSRVTCFDEGHVKAEKTALTI